MNLLLNLLLGLAPALSQDPAVIELNDLLEEQKESSKVDSPDIIRSFAKKSPSRDVVILFNGSGHVGSYESEVFSFFQSSDFNRLRKQFPDHDIVTFSSSDKAEIRKTLEEIMKDYKGVKGFMALSLGKKPELVQTDKGDRIALTTWSKRGDFRVDLTDESQVREVFAPLIGKFTKDSKAIFGGGQMIVDLSDLEKLKLMKKVAKNFKMESGRIYFNESIATDPYAQYFGAPFYERRHNKFGTLLAQLFFPRYLWRAHRHESRVDKGNTLKVDRNMYSLYDDSRVNALTSCRSKGEIEGHCLFQQVESERNGKRAKSSAEGVLVEPQKTVVDSAQ